ncbi:RNA-binding domain-containing protein [Metschnikowia bicuspidata var. bicuspidata NRRL YB-4993]|uniref:RNA-binding domain-containing protein n=1 Tax=Metschnikowia bicuspidata var. bicuspidata NRRL YB-4993 TaxID=869754 RepID=A0A1A0H8P5_9ASCO|nr:RNA-binding domain-containing protein [Metschnikowia bicuspidata var. bicuspidata NRRL YB-4993]OBA20386.1 RNA-binding domain-containing protein [Metschnikowia bicuspidata var. bicuspidata NRRL YB-4993]
MFLPLFFPFSPEQKNHHHQKNMSDSGSPPPSDVPQSPAQNADQIPLEQAAPAQAPAQSKLFVRPIGFDTTREAVEDHFASAGTVVDVHMMRGFAFVSFSSSEEAARAQETLSNTDLDGNSLQIEFAKERREDTRGQFRVKVTNLPEGTAWQDFKDFVREKTECSPTFAKVFRDYESGETIGNLEFSSSDELDKAISVLNQADYQDAVISAEQDTSPFVPPARRGGFRGGRGGRGDYGGRGGRGDFRGGRGGYDRDDNRSYERDSYTRDRSPTRY